MINSSPINSAPINATAEAFTPLGFAGIAFTQDVGYPKGSTGVSFKQTVGATGQASLAFTQTVFDETFVATSWNNWDVVVKVDGVDVGEALTDAGEIRIDAERSSARLAEFSLLLSGTIEAQSWTGKAVTIDWIQSNGAVWRLFTGVIVEPVLNLANFTIRCRCTDDLQRIIDNQTNPQLLTLTGGYWSKYVFDEGATGWKYLQDLLSTQSKSVEMDAFGTLRANSLQNKETPDFTYTNSLILDESVSVNFGQRASLINWVDVNFSARFERLYQRNERLIWVHPETFCQNQSNAIIYPSQNMARDAIDSAGWVLTAESFTGLWPTGTYICGGAPVLWANTYPDGIRGFDLRAAFRWKQSVTDQFMLSVTSPASIAVYGELKSDYKTAADFSANAPDWTGTDADYTSPLTGFLVDELHNAYQDQFNDLELQFALQTAVAVAIERIKASHRNIKVQFRLPLAPYLDLANTLRINDSNVQAKGIVWRLQHVLNLSTAEAVTEIELAISAGQSGADLAGNLYSLPVHPDQPAPTGYQDIIDVPEHIGGLISSPAFDDNWWGVITNTDGALASTPYPQELRLQFPAIPDTKTQNKTDTIPHAIQIAVDDNLLTITA
jgi:hypothetical protein